MLQLPNLSVFLFIIVPGEHCFVILSGPMAPLTLSFLALSFVVYIIWKIIGSSRRDKVPSGLKRLPGPKGMVHTLHVPIRASSPHDTAPTNRRRISDNRVCT